MSQASSRNPTAETLHYLRADMRADAVAGLTVAVMGVPQAMAYALIAGLPPVYGLYTAIVTCVVAAVIGSSRHLVTGPTNALCMVILSLTAHLPDKYDISLLEAVLFLTFFTGLVQLLFGVLRLGAIMRYVSNSVVVGFTAGAGIMIAVNQLKNLLGLDLSGVHAERFHEVVYATASHLGDLNPYAATVGIVTALIVVLAPKLHKRLPGALLGVSVGGAITYLAGWYLPEMGHFKVDIVKDIEPIRGVLMSFSVPEKIASPSYELTRELGLGAVALALLGLIEAASIARAVASSSGQRLNFTREFIGQGTSNIVGSFLGCFAGSGSFTRTAVCYKSGGRTRMAAIFSALWTLIALLLLGEIANFIPKAALAGILIVVAYSMIDKHHLKLSWTSGASPRLVLMGTLLSTLVLPLEYAVFVGVFLSIFILLRTTGKTDLTQLVPSDDSHFEEVPFNEAASSPVVTVNMEGDLYFAAAEDLDYELLRCLRPETRVVVLRMKRLRAVGATAMAMLQHFYELLQQRNVQLVACGIEDELAEVLTGSGLRKKIGEQNLFYADNRLFRSTELAMARAWSLVKYEQRQAKRSQTPGAVAGGTTTGGLELHAITADTLVSKRSIRFGYQHQLREAVWLMSGLLEHSKSLHPEPLFLQSREARLFGELSPWRALRTLTRDLTSDELAGASDAEVAERLRQHLGESIATIARQDVGDLGGRAPLACVIEQSLRLEQLVVPVCHEDGRLKGQVTSDAMLHGLRSLLSDAGLVSSAGGSLVAGDTTVGSAPPEPRDGIVARNLLVTNVATIRDDATLQSAAQALGALFEAEAATPQPRALVVVDAAGGYRGLLTARWLLRGLFALWEPGTDLLKDEAGLSAQLSEVVRARAGVSVRDALIQGLPTVTEETRLVPLIEAACGAQLEFVPVVVDGRPRGLVPLTRIFTAAASLALTPDDEGIRSDGGKFT